MRWTLTLLVGLAVMVASASSAQAGSIGRYFGLGSGPGYHAYNNCPTVPRHLGHGHHPGYTMGPVYSQPFPAVMESEVIESPAATPTPAKAPSSSRRTSAPQLPSQRMSHQPAFWYK